MQQVEAVYVKIQPKVYMFFYARTLHHSLSEDLTQDVFFAAFKGFHHFKGEATIETWIFSIAQNVLKKHYRSNKYQRNLADNLKETLNINEQSPEDIFLVNEEVETLITHIQALDDLQKEIVILRVFVELSFKEIGQLVQKSENYVRVTFHRSKLKLQAEMEARK